MKKISLLLVVLLAAGSASLYGQMMVGTDFSISGDAKATAGYDLDDEQFGFKNEANSNIKFEVVAKQSSDNGMMGEVGWVGVIELKDFKIIIDNDEEDSDLRYMAAECQIDIDMDQITKNQPTASECETNKTSRSRLVVTAPDITAKLTNGPLFLKIYSEPANVADLVAAVEDDDNTEGDPEGGRAAESDDVDLDVGTDLGGMGVTLGYDSGGGLMVALGITSTEPWDSAKDPDMGSFAISGELVVDLGPAGLKLQVVQGLKGDGVAEPTNDDDTGVAGELTTTFGVVELTAGADVRITNAKDMDANPEDESMYFEVGLGANVTLAEIKDDEGMVTASTKFGADYIYSSEQMVASDVKVSLDDDGGLVDRLGMGLTWGLFDISNGVADFLTNGDPKYGYEDNPLTHNDQMDMFVEGTLSYKLDAMGGTLTPAAKLTLNQIDDLDATVGLEVKAVLTGAVPATEFGLMWATSNLSDTDAMMAKSGAITAWAKITYS